MIVSDGLAIGIHRKPDGIPFTNNSLHSGNSSFLPPTLPRSREPWKKGIESMTPGLSPASIGHSTAGESSRESLFISLVCIRQSGMVSAGRKEYNTSSLKTRCIDLRRGRRTKNHNLWTRIPSDFQQSTRRRKRRGQLSPFSKIAVDSASLTFKLKVLRQLPSQVQWRSIDRLPLEQTYTHKARLASEASTAN